MRLSICGSQIRISEFAQFLLLRGLFLIFLLFFFYLEISLAAAEHLFSALFLASVWCILNSVAEWLECETLNM